MERYSGSDEALEYAARKLGMDENASDDAILLALDRYIRSRMGREVPLDVRATINQIGGTNEVLEDAWACATHAAKMRLRLPPALDGMY